MQQEIYYSKEWDEGLEDTPEEWQNILEQYNKFASDMSEE